MYIYVLCNYDTSQITYTHQRKKERHAEKERERDGTMVYNLANNLSNFMDFYVNM